MLMSNTAFAQDQSIEEFEVAQQASWNSHDAGAYAAAFDTNAEIVISLGWKFVGQAQAASNFGDGFKYIYAQASLRLSKVKIRMLTSDLALVTLGWAIDGARTIDTGLPAAAQHGLETQLLQRRGRSWMILSQQDTAAVSLPPSPAQAAKPVEAFLTTPPPIRRCIMARANGNCLIYGKAK